MRQPVVFRVEAPPAPRNRLTGGFRPILVIPHALLVGGPFFGAGFGAFRGGALGLLAATIAIFDWVAIVFTGHPIQGLQPLKRFYLQWRARMLTYACLLRDEFPPFGDGVYPVELELPPEPEVRDRWTVALRLFMIIPHALVLIGLALAEIVVWVVSWLMIIVTGHLPDSLWRFGRDVVAYALRLETYTLLVHDHYPPFVLTEEDAAAYELAR